jgi:hypothetical protein
MELSTVSRSGGTQRSSHSSSWRSLVLPLNRQLVFTDYYKGGDHVVWIDGATGRVLARSPVLAHTPAPGNIVMPGFDGRFYYLGNGGQL